MREISDKTRGTAKISINHNIEFRFNYGVWEKFVDGSRVVIANGVTYEEFIEQVIHQYPIDKVDQFYLTS
jgi:hypothetical protein